MDYYNISIILLVYFFIMFMYNVMYVGNKIKRKVFIFLIPRINII